MATKVSSPRMSRRDFTKVVTAFLGSIMGFMVGVPLIGYIISPAIRKGSDEGDLVSLGPLENYPVGLPPTLFTFTRTKINGWERTANSYGVYVYRPDESQIRVFSNICTHLSCRVTYKEESQTYDCPCHDASFAVDGDVVHGPPPRPLDEYEWQLEDGNLLINFVEG